VARTVDTTRVAAILMIPKQWHGAWKRLLAWGSFPRF
jgi:hypothetical protein